MNKADKVAASQARALIEEMLLARKPIPEIMQAVAAKTGEAFDIDDIKAYREEYTDKGRSLITEVLGISKNMAQHEIPPLTDADQLSQYFSFKNTNDDLEMIYDRIRELREDAKKRPEDDTLDSRVIKYLDQAEKIRQRVIKNQFDDLRKTILLTIGKKIASAAVSVFLPYVTPSRKDEARKKFLSAIEPLIDSEIVPKVPDDIQEVEKDIHGE